MLPPLNPSLKKEVQNPQQCGMTNRANKNVKTRKLEKHKLCSNYNNIKISPHRILQSLFVFHHKTMVYWKKWKRFFLEKTQIVMERCWWNTSQLISKTVKKTSVECQSVILAKKKCSIWREKGCSFQFFSDILIFLGRSFEHLSGGMLGCRCRRNGRRRCFAPTPVFAAATLAWRAPRQIFKWLQKKIKILEKIENYMPIPQYLPKHVTLFILSSSR